MTQSATTSIWLASLLSVFGTLATLLAGFGVYWLTIRGSKKALSYDYSTAQIAQLRTPFSSDLAIMFKGQEVEDASLVSVTVRNSGQVAIKRDDFDGKLEVLQEGSGQVLALQVSEATPNALSSGVELQKMTGSTTKTLFSISALLLNSNDHFTCLALVSGSVGKLSLQGRIVGVKMIERRNESSVINKLKASLSLTVTGMLLGAVWTVAHDLLSVTYYRALNIVIIVVLILKFPSFWKTFK